MSRSDKLIAKLKSSTTTYPWSDLLALLHRLGYEKYERVGSRVIFMHTDGDVIHLHKPHPHNYIKGGALKSVKVHLQKRGVL